MNGLEYLHVYDHCVDDQQVSLLGEYEDHQDGTPRLIAVDDPLLGTLNLDLYKVFGKAFHQYSKGYPSLTLNFTAKIIDGGYTYQRPGVTDLIVPTQEKDGSHAIARAVLFLSDQRYLEFPNQGLTVNGRAGRMAIFPAQWTHPHRLFGTGGFITTTFYYGDEQ